MDIYNIYIYTHTFVIMCVCIYAYIIHVHAVLAEQRGLHVTQADPRTESPLHGARVGARLKGQSFGQPPKLRLYRKPSSRVQEFW